MPGRRLTCPPLPLVARAAAVAGALSGAPSTVHALVTGRSVLAAARTAGTLLGRPTLPRGLVAHTALTVWWTTVLVALLPRRRTVAWGAAGGLAIAALDLGLAGRRFAAIATLPTVPQVLDHVAFGALVGAVRSMECDRRTRGNRLGTDDEESTPDARHHPPDHARPRPPA